MKYSLFILILLCGDFLLAEKIRLIAPAPKPSLSLEEVTTASREPSLGVSGGHFPNPVVADHFDEMSYKYTGGRYENEEIRFRLRTPKKIVPGRKYPLVVWFHGRGESGDDNLSQMSHMHFGIGDIAGPESRDFFLLATQCPTDNREWRINISREDGKGDAPIRITREIMEAVVAEFPVDEDRISAFGLSSGGEAAWQYVMESPEKFSGLVCVSAIPPSGEAVVNMNIWVFCTKQDNAVPVEEVRQKADEINTEGGSVVLTVLDKSGHDAWSDALRDYRVISWLVSQKRDALINPPPGLGPHRQSTAGMFFLFVLPLVGIAVLALISRKRTA